MEFKLLKWFRQRRNSVLMFMENFYVTQTNMDKPVSSSWKKGWETRTVKEGRKRDEGEEREKEKENENVARSGVARV